MPVNSVQLSNYEYTSYYKSAKEVGGDYYDIIQSNGKSFIIVGDISGKGLAAALYMVRVQAILHILTSELSSSKEVLLKLNQSFSKNLHKGYFLTIIASTIEQDGNIKICSAGHTPCYWYKRNEKIVAEINPKGMGIGLTNNKLFEESLTEQSVQLLEGDLLFFFTDGVPDTMNLQKRQFGFERIKKCIQKNAEMPVESLKNTLVKEIEYFCGDAVQQDDLTMVILKYLPKKLS